MSKAFTLSITGSVTLTVEQIWPDGDAPENPTVEDVRARVESWGAVHVVDFIDNERRAFRVDVVAVEEKGG
jgi:hypothetical protein